VPARAAEHWWPAYIALGSNLDGPESQVRRAFDALRALPQTCCHRLSSLYASAPMGPPDQPEYVNACACLLTRLEPEALLAALQRIEADQGRSRDGDRWGPRTLDLDLLVYGGRTSDGDTLRLPHPGIGERNFVLLPLAEIAPDLIVPGLGRVASLSAAIDRQGIRAVQDEM
jgi:2-amino-4-hydroxy-6-hydroxymethyldihydropteridine diphosphokinase